MPYPTNSYSSPALDSLDLPRYRATFGEAVKRFFTKYATFSGRASRSEYWWVMLFNFLVAIVAFALMAAGGGDIFDPDSEMPDTALPGLLLLPIYAIFTFVPSLALGMRRFHDANFSGGLYFLSWVPYVGWPTVLILALMPSNPAGARFDKDWAAATGYPTT